MGFVKDIWRRLTHTKALDQSSGKMEMVFFESVYRVTYITGFSMWDRSIGYLLYSNIIKWVIIYIMFGEIWYAFMKSSSFDEIAGIVNVLVLQIITMYKNKNLIKHKYLYKNLAASMNSPYFDMSTVRRRDLVETWAQKNEKYLRVLFALGNITLVIWFIFPLVDEEEYNLVIDFYLPLDYTTFLRYSIVYILVAIAFWYTAHFVMVTDSIMQVHLIHLLCQFTVLVDCFENLLNDCRVSFEDLSEYDLIRNKNFANKYMERLGNLVQQHKLILNHVMNLRNILSAPMLGQLAASGTLICFIGYQTATTITGSITKCLMSGLFLGYNLFELYIICKWCQEITNWSFKIGEAVYGSGWECGVTRIRGVRPAIVYVIARANKPLIFTAGGMYDLSIASYGSLIKASYSALTMLLRFRHD